MAGIDLGGSQGGKRATNHEIPLIPFIDFLLCLVAFLLVTAVWSQMARVDADARVPGPERGPAQADNEKLLHVDMRGERRFQLSWKEGTTVVATVDVPRRKVEVGAGEFAYPDLARAVASEWRAHGSHRAASDPKLDRAVLHTDNSAVFQDVIAVMDALHAPKRDAVVGDQRAPQPAFHVTFAVN